MDKKEKAVLYSILASGGIVLLKLVATKISGSVALY